MSDILNAAVIGCGAHSPGHFRMIADEPRLRLRGIAELDNQRLQKAASEFRPQGAYLDYRKMLDEGDIDVVYVVTMPGHLLPSVIECLQRGLHVSVEKSPGMTAEETAAMASAARASSAKAIVSFNRRYFPDVLAVRRLVQERGGAIHCAATYNKPLTRIGHGKMGTITPTALMCDAIHHVDLIRWLAGTTLEKAAIPKAVFAATNHGSRGGTDRQNAIVQFDSGSLGVLMSHYGVGSRIQRAEVPAADFSAYMDLTGEHNIELYDSQFEPGQGHGFGSSMEGEIDLESVGGADFNETKHFVDCILNDVEPWSTLDDAIHTMRLCEAIYSGHQGPL